MQKKGFAVEVSEEKFCDYCGQDKQIRALYDGHTKSGPWANMCEFHFKVCGVGLGLGRGQKLIYTKLDKYDRQHRGRSV